MFETWEETEHAIDSTKLTICNDREMYEKAKYELNTYKRVPIHLILSAVKASCISLVCLDSCERLMFYAKVTVACAEELCTDEQTAKIRNTIHVRNRLIAFDERFPKQRSNINPCSEISLGVDYAELEAKACAMYRGHKFEFGPKLYNTKLEALKDRINNPTDLTEKTMSKDYKAVDQKLIGGVDIFTASEAQLVSLVRSMQETIKAEEDMAKVSAKFKARAKDIKESIKLVVEQLDKDVESK